MRAMMTLQAGASFGPYVIEGFVAGGGMGRVYAAAHGVYGNAVALKVLHDRFAADPRWHTRFSDEGLLGLQLKHPHVLSARELVDHEGQAALVMDLVLGGQTLLSAIEREHPSGLSLGDALRIFLRIASGVEYLHERGIVHGDLKPENVLIEGQLRAPAQWMPRVTDFGTVALIADPVVIEGKAAVVASPRYASPEHVLGVDQLDIRSDIYALGLILHWLLSGEHASGARTVNEAAEVVLDPIALVHVVDQPDPLLRVLQTATAPSIDDRYQDCRALALAVRDVLDEIGLSVKLEDLQSELATEIMEGQSAAQQALQRGEGADPDDTELDPGSVIEYAGVDAADVHENLEEFEADLVAVDDPTPSADEITPQGAQLDPEPAESSEEAGAVDEPEEVDADAPTVIGPYSESITDGEDVAAASTPAETQSEAPSEEDDVSSAPEDQSPSPMGSSAAPSGLGGLRIDLKGSPPLGDDPPSADDHPWEEAIEDLPTEPAGARVVVAKPPGDPEDDAAAPPAAPDQTGEFTPPGAPEPSPDTSGAAAPAADPDDAGSSTMRFVLMMTLVGAVIGLASAAVLWAIGVLG